MHIRSGSGKKFDFVQQLAMKQQESDGVRLCPSFYCMIREHSLVQSSTQGFKLKHLLKFIGMTRLLEDHGEKISILHVFLEVHTSFSKRVVMKTLSDFICLQKTLLQLKNCPVSIRDPVTLKVVKHDKLGWYLPVLPKETRAFLSGNPRYS